MAAPTLTQLRAGLAANLAVLDPTGSKIQIAAYILSDPTPPAVHVFPAQIDYQLAMGVGLDRWFFTAQAFVGLTTDIGAQTLLDQFLDPYGPQSVRMALESDNTLGGHAQDVNVISSTGYQQYTAGQSIVLGAEWTVQVLLSGT